MRARFRGFEKVLRNRLAGRTAVLRHLRCGPASGAPPRLRPWC
jgi:hypothetical protein